MKVIPKPFQQKLLEQILKGFETNTKVLLYALCGCGKTIIALTFISIMIARRKRIAISCYSVTDIRKQWQEKIHKFFPNLEEHLQVVCSTKDAKLYQNPFVVTNGNVSKQKKLTIFIPQTINSDLGVFDYFVIDEAHEYLEVAGTTEGQLKRLLSKFSSPKTKYLGITGTGYELMRPGKFFEDACHVIYDLFQGLDDNAINNCELVGEYFNFSLPKNMYNIKKDLNRKGCNKWKTVFGKLNDKGKAILKHNAYTLAKIEKIVETVVGKTLIIIPRGTKCEDVLANFINVIKGNHRAAVVKTSKIDKAICDKNEAMFRDPNSGTDFLIVIDMCGTGWDYEYLNNVVDMTFTRSWRIMIQRFARSIRVVSGKPVSKYYYCIDRSRQKNQAIFDLARALTLTTREGILEEASGTVSSYFFNKKVIVKNGVVDSIESISLQDINYCERLSKEQFYRKTLKEALTAEENVRRKLFGEVLENMMVKNIENAKEFILKLRDTADNEKALALINPGLFKKIFGAKTIQQVLQDVTC